jgi:hypothetical protein
MHTPSHPHQRGRAAAQQVELNSWQPLFKTDEQLYLLIYSYCTNGKWFKGDHAFRE